MNTAVTRGRGELVVTATGMDTEIGHIADLLANTETDKTPLQKQLDGLSKIIASIAGVALVFVVVLGLVRGESFDTLFITGVALAVAAIPTGLPAVVTALLSMGTREIANRNAIVKRLPAVETLGSTSAICSDKTGTLTLNKMTAREMAIPGQHRFSVSGEGYGTTGEIKHVGGSHIDLDPYLLPMVLCADAVLDGESLIGDPTEGALIVLGAKGGLDVDATRRDFPRIAEVPFDSEYKFMATFHEMTGSDGRPVVRCYVKGAPDVLVSRSTSYRAPDGSLVAGDRREPAPGARGQRRHGQLGRAGDGGRPEGLRPRNLPSRRGPPQPGHRPHPAGDGRDRRPAPARGQGGHRRVPRRRDPGADDHRRPRDHGGRHRPRARDRGPGDDRHRVRRDERRAAARGAGRHRRHRPRRARGQDPSGAAAQARRATSSR